jgi:hypothetical protein
MEQVCLQCAPGYSKEGNKSHKEYEPNGEELAMRTEAKCQATKVNHCYT